MKKALIIGPAYPAPYQLAGTINNIANWNNTLTIRGFTSRVIKQGTQTRSAIQAAIQSFVAGLTSSDSAAIILLGHGGRVTDANGDESDGYDEAFSSSDILPITDDWIKAVLASAAIGSKIDVVHDMCYAGTSTRDRKPDGVPLLDPVVFPTECIEFKGKRESLKDRAIIPVSMNHRLWAACADGELSYQCLSGGLYHSIFSLYLCWALRSYPTKTATEIMNIAAGYVTAYVPSQHPQLEGSNLTGVPF
jgi:hypothetical protein